MKNHDVYEEVSTDNVDQETLHNAIDSRWVHKNKTPTEVRSRIVAKRYKEEVEDLDDIYASTPLFVILRVLLTVAMARSWRIRQETCLQHSYMHLLEISTSTFGHQKSTTQKALLFGVSTWQCTDYVPVRKPGKTTLQQAWQNLASSAYSQRRMSTQTALISGEVRGSRSGGSRFNGVGGLNLK